jgi:type 1 glutamine amidotransferase/azurin
MENQIWNADKGEGNAHINPRRDIKHGSIYIVRPKKRNSESLSSLSIEDPKQLIKGLKSDNLFWRTTAQRLIVENNLENLIPEIKNLISEEEIDGEGFNGAAMHALYTLQGLNSVDDESLAKALKNESVAVQRAAINVLPDNTASSDLLVSSGLLNSKNLHVRLSALLRSSELPETEALVNTIEKASLDEINKSDKWLKAALKIYYREQNTEDVNPKAVHMLIPSGEEEQTEWKYAFEKPDENWMKSDFDDTSWSKGQGIFTGLGKNHIRSLRNKLENRMGTKWTSPDIWLRRDIMLNESIEKPVLKIIYDEDYEVYINGVLLKAEKGWTSDYKYFQLDEEAGKLFTIGKNIIAVHCHNTDGDQHIDLGVGKIGKPEADITLELNTVSQKMAYDKKELWATAGQYVEIKLNNKDQMPHNLVVIEQGSLENFGKLIDAFLKNPNAAEMEYVPNSRYVIGATSMIDPGEQGSVFFKVPDKPGRYPFVCTFPGHWRMMQGVLIVLPPANYVATRKNAQKVLTVGGGGSHDFLKFFGIADGKILYNKGEKTIMYTENIAEVPEKLKNADVLFMTNNKPYSEEAKKAIMSHAKAGKGFLIQHPSVWYNWKDWPEYNKTLVGGGSNSHEKLQEFEVQVIKPKHPIMKGVPSSFNIIDELYRWEKDPTGTAIEILAIGKSLETGKDYPVVWIVKHAKAKIIGNTLGHDERAHSLKPYQNILKNSLDWVSE